MVSSSLLSYTGRLENIMQMLSYERQGDKSAALFPYVIFFAKALSNNAISGSSSILFNVSSDKPPGNFIEGFSCFFHKMLSEKAAHCSFDHHPECANIHLSPFSPVNARNPLAQP